MHAMNNGRSSPRRASWTAIVQRALLFSFVCVASAPLSFSEEALAEKNVLVLYSFSPRETFSQLEPLKSATRAQYHGPIHFYVEYLESLHFSDVGYRKAIAEATIQTYRGKHIDMIVAVVYPALQFAVDYRDQLGPDLPIVCLRRLPGAALQAASRGCA